MLKYNWQTLLLSQEERDYVMGMLTIRHKWVGHRTAEDIPLEDVYRDLDTLERFSKVIKADDVFLQKVRDIKTAILYLISTRLVLTPDASNFVEEMQMIRNKPVKKLPPPNGNKRGQSPAIGGRIPEVLVYIIRFKYQNESINDVAEAFGTTYGKVYDIRKEKTFINIREDFKPTSIQKADAIAWMRRHPDYEHGAADKIIKAVENLEV